MTPMNSAQCGTSPVAPPRNLPLCVSSLASAKRRASKRRTDGGAIMFLIAMVLAVLGSVGIYALAAAAMELKTSGNERQNTQTHFLSQLAMIGATDLLTTRGQNYIEWALSPPSGTSPTCQSAQNSCWVLSYGADFSPSIWPSNAIPTYASNPYSGGTPGAFGQVPMGGNFYVELSTIEKAPAPTRNQLNTLAYCYVTLSSYAFTQPSVSTTPSVTNFMDEAEEGQRARVVVGPVPANVCP